MLHFCYKTVNAVNGKFYIGKHSTENLEDGYLGSGDLLKQAIQKYGKENFKREIIRTFETEEDAYLFEKSLIEDWMIESENCYNLKEGGKGVGSGSNHPWFGKKHSPQTLETLSNLKRNPETIEKIASSNRGKKRSEEFRMSRRLAQTGKRHSEETKRKMSSSHAGDKHPMYGKSHSEETKKAWSALKMGSNNNRFGTVHTPETIERMKKSALLIPLKVCEHCGQSVKGVTYNRWHGDNCKKK